MNQMKWVKSIINLFLDYLKNGCRFQAVKALEKAELAADKPAHVSLDDTIDVFKDLSMHCDSYQSIFDNPMLGYLKELHDCYGLKVSLYCFYEDEAGFDLSKATGHFAQEFHDNANWLKFGFHGRNCHVLYDTAEPETIKDDYIRMLRELRRICGGFESITRVIRLSGFQGSRDAILTIRDCELGVKGLFTADDTRKSYYLEHSQTALKEIVVDDITYYHTDIRLESYGKAQLTQALQQERCVIFTHEYYMMSKRMQLMMERLLLNMIKKGFQFSFFE